MRETEVEAAAAVPSFTAFEDFAPPPPPHFGAPAARDVVPTNGAVPMETDDPADFLHVADRSHFRGSGNTASPPSPVIRQAAAVVPVEAPPDDLTGLVPSSSGRKPEVRLSRNDRCLGLLESGEDSREQTRGRAGGGSLSVLSCCPCAPAHFLGLYYGRGSVGLL